MLLNVLALASLFISASLSAPSSALAPFGTFDSATIFTPGPNYTDPGVLYSRTVLLEGGVLLATWENYSPEPPPVYFPIYRSVDGGETWKSFSNIHDQVNGWGLRYQPFLYELPSPIGGFPAGTILAAGNSIPTDLSQTKIDLYASRDKGYTWKFVSHIAAGGRAIPNNGETPVWEPFLMLYQSKMVAYYSDQRDPAHGQKLVHQVSSDLKTWVAPLDDVATANYTDRPGMTTVTQLPNGKYMMTYEFGGFHGSTSYSFPAYYRIADNPLDFNNAEGLPIITPDGTQPQSSPYITWTPVGGPHGSICVSTGTHTEIFVNRALGDVNKWEKVATPEPVSYTRHLRVMPNRDHLLIAGGGVLPPTTSNTVHVGVIDLLKALN